MAVMFKLNTQSLDLIHHVHRNMMKISLSYNMSGETFTR